MAVETPLHEQRVFSPGHRHLINRSVARRALNALVHVNAVIEVDEIRQIVDAGPLERTILAITDAHRLERWTIRPHLTVAVHADLRRRNAGEGACFDGGVTVAAINADARHVMFMAERNGLLAHNASLGKVGRTDEYAYDRHNGNDYEHSTEDADSRQHIGTAMKNLRHETR